MVVELEVCKTSIIYVHLFKFTHYLHLWDLISFQQAGGSNSDDWLETLGWKLIAPNHQKLNIPSPYEYFKFSSAVETHISSVYTEVISVFPFFLIFGGNFCNPP